jgi:hypothetical protein
MQDTACEDKRDASKKADRKAARTSETIPVPAPTHRVKVIDEESLS